MKSDVLLRALEAALRPRVTAAGGHLDVASDPEHVLELLAAAAPRGFRAILAYAGEDAVDPDESPGIVEWKITLTLQAANGLTLSPGALVHQHSNTQDPAHARLPLLSLKDLASQWLRGLKPIQNTGLFHQGFRALSAQWLEIEGLPTRQLTLTHRCLLSLPHAIPADLIFDLTEL